MSLTPGSSLGPYEISERLGAGGMGEVYRAKDKRLDRTVAIKVLPGELSGRTEMRQRLEREARTISSLSHAHICALFDVGETDDGSMYLVMEYIEGESLAERLGRGPMPLRQAVRAAVEIAEALDGAHRQQIVHRDLKPGNVMLTKSGVKLLDFGLAKAAGPGSLLSSDQNAPTLQQASVTEEGTIVGTLHYMAPEQLEGKPADARSDIFAFGATLYEMLTGKRAFEATSRVGVVAKILHEDPEPLTGVPPALARVIEHCLKKDPDERWQTAGDIAIQLRGMSDASSEKAEVVRAGTKRNWWWQALAALLLIALGAAGAIAWQRMRPRTNASGVTHLSLLMPADHNLSVSDDSGVLAISPDGTFIIFAATGADGVSSLHMRRLDTFEITRIPGTERAFTALVSPDSREIAFVVPHGKMKRVALAGGTPEIICDAVPAPGGVWGSDGRIVFNPMPAGPLYSVPAAGGTPVPLTEAAATLGRYHPEIDLLLYVSEVDGKSFDDADIVAYSLATKSSTVVARGTAPRYVENAGKLLFVRTDKLWSVGFDPKERRASGTPVVVAEPIMIYPGTGQALYDVSADGTVVYAPFDNSRIRKRLMLVDRLGSAKPLPFPPNLYESPRLSADGGLLSMEIVGSNNDVWMGDIVRGTLNRLTTTSENLAPILSPDGRFVMAARWDRSSPNLGMMRTDGVGEAVMFMPPDRARFPYSWSSDGRSVAYVELMGETRGDISLLDLETKRVMPLLRSRFDETDPALSPDGKWVAYVSDETGRPEVYVRSIAAEGTKLRISTEGGNEPLWSHGGRELFYRKDDGLYAVDVATAGGLKASEPKKLFEVPMSRRDVTRSYDVTPGDRSFVYVERADASRMRSINIVTNALEGRDR